MRGEAVIVCGIDPSLTNTGIAILRDGNPAQITNVGHGTLSGKTYRHRSNRIVSQARSVMQVLWQHCTEPQLAPDGLFDPDKLPAVRIDLAVMEGPAYGFTNRPSGHDAAGLWWGIYSALLAKRVPVAVMPPSSLKIWVTGRGNAEKADMLAAVKGWYRNVRNDDQADALGLATVGAFHLGDPVPFETKGRHDEAIAKVEWPQAVTA